MAVTGDSGRPPCKDVLVRGVRFDPKTKTSTTVYRKMTIWLPGADYFTISKINGLGLPNVEKPLQCIYLLPPPLQTCCSHFDQLTTNLLLVNPSQKMNKGTPVRFKLEHRDVVLKRAEWLIF